MQRHINYKFQLWKKIKHNHIHKASKNNLISEPFSTPVFVPAGHSRAEGAPVPGDSTTVLHGREYTLRVAHV